MDNTKTYQWHPFNIKDASTYPPEKGKYIVSLHFPEDFSDYSINDYTCISRWAEYVTGEFDWSPQFESKFVTAWTFLPEPYKND